MENEEIVQLMEGFETVWQRVSAVPVCVEEAPTEPLSCVPQQAAAYQPRWFCVF